MAAGAAARLDGATLYLVSDDQVVSVLAPDAVDFPDEVVGRWVAEDPDAGEVASITFEPTGQFRVNACNSGGGRWWVEDDQIITGDGTQTLIGCFSVLESAAFSQTFPFPEGDEITVTVEVTEETVDAHGAEPGTYEVTFVRRS